MLNWKFSLPKQRKFSRTCPSMISDKIFTRGMTALSPFRANSIIKCPALLPGAMMTSRPKLLPRTTSGSMVLWLRRSVIDICFPF